MKVVIWSEKVAKLFGHGRHGVLDAQQLEASTFPSSFFIFIFVRKKKPI